MSKGVVYGLRDPTTLELRYVGKTTKLLETRLYEHVGDARRGAEQYVHRWIRKMGHPPEAIVLEHDPVGGLNEAERAWIAYARSMGCRLTNLTEGGDGGPGFRGPHSEASRRKMRAAATKTWADPEVRRKRSQAQSNRSPETRKGPPRGQALSTQHRDRISKSLKRYRAQVQEELAQAT